MMRRACHDFYKMKTLGKMMANESLLVV